MLYVLNLKLNLDAHVRSFFMRSLILSAFFWMGCTQRAHAQSDIGSLQPYLLHYTVEDGLPNNTVYQAITDSIGQLWFATESGISMFDGYGFTNYSQKDGLQGNVIFGFHKDQKHRIWYYSFEGTVGCWEHGAWQTIAANDTLRQHYGGKVIGSMHVNDDGSLLLGFKEMYGSGIVKIEVDGTVTELEIPNRSAHTLQKPFADAFVWTHGWGLEKSIRIHDSELGVIDLDDPFPKDQLRVLYGSQDSGYWLAIGPRLFLLQNGALVPKGTFEGGVLAVFTDSINHLDLIATEVGVFVMRDGIVVDQLLEGREVYHAFQDKEGGYWFCTRREGVYYWPPDRPHYMPFYRENLFTQLPHVGSRVLLANDLGLYAFAQKENGLVLRDSVSFSGQPSLEYDNGALYLELDNELKLLDPTTLRLHWSQFPYDLYCAVNDGSKHFVSSIGVQMLESVSDSDATTIDTTFKARTFSMLLEKQRLLLGTSNGLWQWHDSTVTKLNIPEVIVNNRVNDIVFCDSGYLLNLPGRGVYWWDGSTDAKAIAYRVSRADFVQQILPMNNGNYIAHSLLGFERLKRIQNTWIPEAANGTFSNFVNTGEAAMNDDTLWVLHKSGLLVQPMIDLPNLSPISTHITLFECQEENLLLHTAPLELNHDQNDFRIRFKAISPAHNPSITYRYRINADDWIASTEREVSLLNLSSGEYTFEVQALISGAAAGPAASVRFEVLPALWQRPWFLILTGTSILLLAFSGGAFINLQKRLVLEEAFLKERAQLQALRTQVNPHFLFNVFNSIQHLMLNNEPREASRSVSRFARLMRLALAHSHKEFILVSDEIEFLKLYLSLENLRMEHPVEGQFEVAPNLDADSVLIPPLMLQVLVENALWHGLSHLNAPGKVIITFECKNKCLIVTVADDGVGRTKAAAIKNRYASSYSSHGMNLVNEKLQIVHKLYGQTSEGNFLTIEDVCPGTENPGTIVTCKLPFRERY